MLFVGKHPNTFSLLLLGLLAVSCGGDKKNREKSAAGPAAAPATAAPAAGKLSQINVFVDMSGGMQGFVQRVAPGQPGSGFQQTVTELLSDVNARQTRQAAAPAYYFFKESTPADARVLVPSTYAEMTNTVSGGLKNAARGSELPQMLHEALRLQAKKPGTVSLLISDFIFAPKDPSQTWKIKTFIKDALSEVEASKLGVSVFANTSEFRGSFYPGNRSGKQPLNGEKIPYYIWVLGDPALVAQVDGGLLRKLARQPQAHFNVRFAPPYEVLDFLNPVGSWMATPPAAPEAGPLVTFTRKPTPRDPAEVTIGLDLSKLSAAQVGEITSRTLRLSQDATAATLDKVWPLAQEPGVKAQPALRKYTHFARLRLVQAPAVRTTLHLEMARPEPTWIASYSTDSDDNIKAQPAKTFRFQEVMQGVADYFADEPGARRVFSLPLQVEARD